MAVPTLPTTSASASAGVTAGPLGMPVALATPVLPAAEVVTALPVRGPSLPTRFNDRTLTGLVPGVPPRVRTTTQTLPRALPQLPSHRHTITPSR